MPGDEGGGEKKGPTYNIAQMFYIVKREFNLIWWEFALFLVVSVLYFDLRCIARLCAGAAASRAGFHRGRVLDT